MRNDQIIDSLGKIDEDIIQKVYDARTVKKTGTVFRRCLSAAACFVLLLSIALTAEATAGSVSNLLAPLFGGAQTQIVDQMGIPVGASVSVNGYTLTADAIIGDRYHFAVVYSLFREDGQPIPDGICFQDWDTAVGGSGSAVLSSIRKDADDPSVAHFTEKWKRQAPLIGRIVTASFSTLAVENEEGEDTVIAEGTWKLTYTLRYQDSSEEIRLKDFYITDKGGNGYKVKKIVLSPVGIHLDLIYYDPDITSFQNGIFRDFTLVLRLTDGTELKLEGGSGGKWIEGEKTAKLSYSEMFDAPIPREDIDAIVICGMVYELQASG